MSRGEYTFRKPPTWRIISEGVWSSTPGARACAEEEKKRGACDRAIEREGIPHSYYLYKEIQRTIEIFLFIQEDVFLMTGALWRYLREFHVGSRLFTTTVWGPSYYKVFLEREMFVAHETDLEMEECYYYFSCYSKLL